MEVPGLKALLLLTKTIVTWGGACRFGAEMRDNWREVVNIFVRRYKILELQMSVGLILFLDGQHSGDLRRHPSVVFQQGDVCSERRAFTGLGHARQEKGR